MIPTPCRSPDAPAAHLVRPPGPAARPAPPEHYFQRGICRREPAGSVGTPEWAEYMTLRKRIAEPKAQGWAVVVSASSGG